MQCVPASSPPMQVPPSSHSSPTAMSITPFPHTAATVGALVDVDVGVALGGNGVNVLVGGLVAVEVAVEVDVAVKVSVTVGI